MCCIIAVILLLNLYQSSDHSLYPCHGKISFDPNRCSNKEIHGVHTFTKKKKIGK